uniref:GP56 n=1 Tax=Caviid herpesvirus 2 str. CIDMTR TaxID=1415526 RepID=U6H8D7_9BETA|nr:GP56 [Caviid herpesvirus 2 str. CIDMTR]
MNSLQKLGVVCSKCNECALELQCLKYCDPVAILADGGPFKRNARIVAKLHATLYPSLREQNEQATTVLTLYLEMLIRCMHEDFTRMDAALRRFIDDGDRVAYYRRVLRLDVCDRHYRKIVSLNDHVSFDVKVDTLNDVERVICKLNCVYGLMCPSEGFALCRDLHDYLSRSHGVSPVVATETYHEAATCYKCYEELTVVPNQGRSIGKRLSGLLCDHVAVCKPLVQLETDMQTIEQDVIETVGRHDRLIGIISAIKNIATVTEGQHAYIGEAERALKEYNIFSEIPQQIYSLSDFTYWSKTSETIVKHVNVTIKQVNMYHHLCTLLQNELSKIFYGEPIVDMFTCMNVDLTEDERLFVGSVYAAPGKIIDLITSMSIKMFEDNPIFNRLHENNEVYMKIKYLIEEIRRPADSKESEILDDTAVSGQAGDPLYGGNPYAKQHDIDKEVVVRKRAYLRKVSEAGYEKVMRCIKKQENCISKLVNVNVMGTVVLEALSKLMNGFIRRIEVDESVMHVSDMVSYDDHLYVKNNLLHRTLPLESLPALGQEIYRFLNGPVFTHHRDFYGLPFNVNMAYACDNAGMLPHMKDDLVRCVEGTPNPNEWMVSEYRKFFDFSDVTDLNTLQNRMWLYIRELVSSVALYNEKFGKQVQIYRIDEVSLTEVKGIVLTYNVGSPLFLVHEEGICRGDDLYSLLYQHLKGSRKTVTVRAEDEEVAPVKTRTSFDNATRTRYREIENSLLQLARDVDISFDDLVPRCLL